MTNVFDFLYFMSFIVQNDNAKYMQNNAAILYFHKSLYSFNFTGGYECFYKRSLGEMMVRDGCARSLFIAFPHSCVPGNLHKNAGRRERKFI